MRNYSMKKRLATAIIFALLPGPAFAGSSDYSSAAMANDTGISQSVIQAATDWFNADANSDTYQNNETLNTGNALGGQSQTASNLANNQYNAATDPYFMGIEGNYQNRYEGDWSNYLYNENAYNSASSAYNTCVADGKFDCINNSGQYADSASYYYGRYQYYYGLWNEDVQQAQAMDQTASQQSTLAGSAAQNSNADFQAYQGAVNAIGSQSSSMSQNTEAANTGNNSASRSEGDASASSQIASLDAAANKSISSMESTTGQNFQSTPTSGTSISSTPGTVADAHSNQNYQSDAQGMADANGAIAAINQKEGQQPAALPTTPAETGPSGTGSIEDTQLQTQVNNLSNAATQNAENSLIQQSYANNRSADAVSANEMAASDRAAASVAPTPESAAMWGDGASADSATSMRYQQDANATSNTADQDLQTYQADQSEADADALQLNNNLVQQADAQAEASLKANGITQSGPAINSSAMNTALNNQEAAMSAAQIKAELNAAKALNYEQQSKNATALQATAQQMDQADNSNASSARTGDLRATWGSMASSYQESATADKSVSSNDTEKSNAYTSAANADEKQAGTADAGYGVNSDAVSAGNAAASAEIAAINAKLEPKTAQ